MWISDPQTAMSALVNGEIDFYEAPNNDFLPILAKAKGRILLNLDVKDAIYAEVVAADREMAYPVLMARLLPAGLLG